MELRQALQKAQTDPRIKRSDLILINQLQKSVNITGLQYDFAVRTLKRYGIAVEEKIQGRRATLRENRIFVFGELRGEEQKKINDLPGAIFYKEEMHLPCNHYTIKILREMKYQLSANIVEWEEKNKIVAPEQGEFDERLFPYQREGVERLEQLNGRALLSDVVGLGKSAQVATYIVRNMPDDPVLIVCPSGLRLNWERELRLWNYKGNIKIVNGKKDTLPKTGIIIISYNVVYNYFCEIEDIGVKLLCCDESQALIHEGSQRTKSVKYLSKGIEKVIMITATPLTSRPKNMFTQLNLISPEMFNSRVKFLDLYCNAKKDPSGNGCSNSRQLHQILSDSFLIRRTKEEVMNQLPSKMYQVIPVQIDKEYRDKYEFAKKEIVEYIKINYGSAAANRARFGETMVKMEHLKQIAVEAKLEESIEYINTIIESGEPVVLFVTHKFVVERLMEAFGDSALKIDGSLSVKQKQANVDRFQTDEKIMVMVCNIEAGSTGITLTRANHCVFIQFPWTPHSLIQGFGRIDRVGQKSKVLNFHYIVADDTIDQTICNILDRKARIIGEIMDGDPEIEEGLLLNELIEQFKKCD
jgi:SWI/SNF-related matrix-associated actin-dependent regulator 1 of chromatin subfamily A